MEMEAAGRKARHDDDADAPSRCPPHRLYLLLVTWYQLDHSLLILCSSAYIANLQFSTASLMRPRPLFITSSTNKLIKMNGQLHLEPSEVSLIFRLYIILYMHRVIVQSETLESRTCYDFIMLCVCSFFFCSIFSP